ncbi:MAG: hypothetical protein ACYC7B_04855 [Burkholderiales bacterium]
MTPLFTALAQRVAAWRSTGHSCEGYPAIGEVLAWARSTDDGSKLRCLRRPQAKALETYWYLRLVEDTAHIFDLYRKFYPKQSELLAALGLDHEKIRAYVLDEGIDAL